MCRLFHIRAASKYGYGYEILIMKTWHVILILILCLLCFLAGRHTNRIGDELVGKTDTSTLRDTIRDSIPYPVYETVIQTVPELFPVYITLEGDTVREPIFVPIPVTQKEYLTDDYHAWVSGYNPSLDSIDVFQKTIYITEKVKTRRVGNRPYDWLWDRKKWPVSLYWYRWVLSYLVDFFSFYRFNVSIGRSASEGRAVFLFQNRK